MASSDEQFMARALALAAQGEGWVEPNPMVGCVVVRDGQILGEGWHQKFGRPHAEVNALAQAGAKGGNRVAGDGAAGATLYVTLEPCCHVGKTPPCTEAICRAGIARAVIALRDPFSKVDGAGIAALEAAGIECSVGIMENEARQLAAPYIRRITTGRPWIIAKWAMTLDGKIASHTGDSRWISNEASRAVVHRLRGRVDAVMVGSRTALGDDPLLTARPEEPTDLKRTAVRIVVDSSASLPLECRLVKTATEVPVLLAVGNKAPPDHCRQLTEAGVEIFRCEGDSHADLLAALLQELGKREMTNVLAEGGAGLLGILWDMEAIDEVHTFIAPKLLGGATAPSPIAGQGLLHIADSIHLSNQQVEILGTDLYLSGRVVRP